ncbi:unnamed protein product [Rotaria magnacalcarata]|uniref:Uncharacterized protein n=2 Tax=Rotaria magnacalcarata TaxID=392030 RepID=A0A816SX69_9BILA|nr:unnamed protein product [Rotaria magnacalcarata]CAF1489121.1 unnamed protein product [Rotaria magnacalcarata]CAF2011354.1 unnamed protein product [Rotaria magnacalcarata]CAF2088721.1 unnamed protein product [Rotaria magnacalcarata]CAF2093491.1 unnamed protein product [Rotaria magnacalcarata]
MFNYATIKQLLLLYSDIFEDRSSSLFAFQHFHFYSRISNMNIGAWPMEKELLTDCHVQHRETSLIDHNQLFWTKVLLQTSPYDEKRYRRITSNACERIVQEEKKSSSSRATLHRPSSVIAVSFSETSTRQNSSTNRSTSKPMSSSMNSRKKLSYTRFSCYLKSHNTNNYSKKFKTKLSTVVPKNNNYYHHQTNMNCLSSRKKLVESTNQCNEKLCQKCLKLIKINSKHISSNSFCQACSHLIKSSKNNTISLKTFSLNKSEENELRQIIEIIIEEFQDHFGQALNLSIKQMTQHLLSNINLFYNHYQQEFEQLTKKYRLEFLERFITLMNKYQNSEAKTNHIIQKNKLSIHDRNFITHPPDILSMSSLSGSLATTKDRSEILGNAMTPSNSISSATTSNRSISINTKTNLNSDRKNLSTQNSSSKKTITLNRTRQRQSLSKSSKQASSSRPLIDAYRFRDTLRINNTHFSSPHSKIR